MAIVGWCHIRIDYDNYPEVSRRYVQAVCDSYQRYIRRCCLIPYNTPEVMRVEGKNVSEIIRS